MPLGIFPPCHTACLWVIIYKGCIGIQVHGEPQFGSFNRTIYIFLYICIQFIGEPQFVSLNRTICIIFCICSQSHTEPQFVSLDRTACIILWDKVLYPKSLGQREAVPNNSAIGNLFFLMGGYVISYTAATLGPYLELRALTPLLQEWRAELDGRCSRQCAWGDKKKLITSYIGVLFF